MSKLKQILDDHKQLTDLIQQDYQAGIDLQKCKEELKKKYNLGDRYEVEYSMRDLVSKTAIEEHK